MMIENVAGEGDMSVSVPDMRWIMRCERLRPTPLPDALVVKNGVKI